MDKDTQTESAMLAQRFEKIANRAQFAREHGLPGGGAMIYQNIRGLKPISLEGAIAYAQGFGCSIEEISPRLAKRLARIPIKAHEPKQEYRVSNITPLDAPLNDLQKQLIAVTRTMSETGLAILLGRAQEMALRHPKSAPKTLEN